MTQSSDFDHTNLDSITDYIRWCSSVLSSSEVFFGHGTDNALDEARSLVLSAVSLPFSIPDYLLGSRLTPVEQQRIADWLQARVQDRKPLAYLTQEMYFAQLPFYIDERVLIPRSPFAELIDERFAPWLSEDATVDTILDLCTGSGCIGIAAAMEFDAAVTLADISPDALDVANINAETYDDYIDITLVETDLFANVSGTFDLIITNPPYVDADEMAAMPAEYHHEPELSLASGDDGLLHIRQILEQAGEYLNEGGLLFAEVGASQQQMMQSLADMPVTWLELSQGGMGIFMATKADLDAYAASGQS